MTSLSLPARTAEIITRYSMAPAGTRLGVAVSGGADSVALLHLLDQLSSRFDWKLVVLHCNHLLRGPESHADERFVAELAARLDLPFFVSRGPLASGNVEEQARAARRAFFSSQRLSQGLSVIALGHTRSDQAETVLLRFLRGSGTAGLAAMPFVSSDGLIRPLLGFNRAEVREWAAHEKLRWREDASNLDRQFRRNRVRLEILPLLAKEFNPNLEGILAGMADVAQAENTFWVEQVGRVWDSITARNRFGTALSVPELREQPVALRRRVLRRAVEEAKGDLRAIDLSHIDAVLKLLESPHGHDRVMVPGIDALRSFDTILLAAPGALSQPREYRLDIHPDHEQVLPFGAGRVCFYLLKDQLPICANFKGASDLVAESVDVNATRLEGTSLVVRNWEPGDALERPGNHAVKLKFLFQESKIPLWDRRHWPVLVCGEKIVWTRQFGCSSGFEALADGGPTARIIYQRAG